MSWPLFVPPPELKGPPAPSGRERLGKAALWAAALGGGLIALSAAVGMVAGLSLEGLVRVWWLEEAGAAGVLLGGMTGVATRTREGASPP